MPSHFVSFNTADTAAALFDLGATIGRKELETCTVVSRLWVELKRITENAVQMEDVKWQKSDYEKKSKDCQKPHDSKPSWSLPQSFQEKF